LKKNVRGVVLAHGGIAIATQIKVITGALG